MSMKKKFLALALAGAVAMPVVANATTMKPVTGDDTNPIDSTVEIEGSVLNNQGVAQAGKLHVEIPTALAFTVDQAGNFTAGSGYQISNKSASPIKVDIAEFTETQNSTGITIKAMTELDEVSERSGLNRSNISLELQGDTTAVDLSTVQQGTPKALFERIESAQSETLVLNGYAGTNTTSASGHDAVQNGVSEDFIVKFRISKHS